MLSDISITKQGVEEKYAPRTLGEILSEYLFQTNAKFASVYRKHITEQKAKLARNVTSIKKGGHDGTNRI